MWVAELLCLYHFFPIGKNKVETQRQELELPDR